MFTAESYLTIEQHQKVAWLNYNPYDIKALFHPVDFMVFNGMNKGKEIDDIVFLSHKVIEDNIIKSLKKAVENKYYS